MTKLRVYPVDLQSMLSAALQVTAERGWQKYHTPKNMALDLARETGEALEHLVWETDEQIKADSGRIAEIKDELGDVLHALLLLSESLGIDLTAAFWDKLEKVKTKYPVREVQGVSGYAYKRKG